MDIIAVCFTKLLIVYFPIIYDIYYIKFHRSFFFFSYDSLIMFFMNENILQKNNIRIYTG